TQLCRADGGNTQHFTCPYHTWTYDTQGRLLSTSFDQYYDRQDFAQLGLVPVAQFETYAGLMFATWNPQAPPLKTYLGDLTWYLDMIFRRTPGGMELINPPQRCVVETNWKITALNFMDSQHAARVHRGPMEIGASSGPISYADLTRAFAHSPQMYFPNGHGCILIQLPAGLPDFCGLAPELVSRYRDTLNPHQYEFLRRLFASVGTIFPNLSWVHPVLVVAPDRPPFAFLSLRLWQPLGPQKIEVWNWYLIDREAPAAWKEEARRNAVRTFSMSGLLEEDDVEVWAALTRATRGSIARRYTADFRAGATATPVTDFPGPGTVYPSLFPENEQVNFLRHWQQCMQQE
ncbi:MAG: SRPBCC family protein, partial [Candidatus Binatia bacterium]